MRVDYWCKNYVGRGGGHQKITLDYRGEGVGPGSPKKDYVIFEWSLITCLGFGFGVVFGFCPFGFCVVFGFFSFGFGFFPLYLSPGLFGGLSPKDA